MRPVCKGEIVYSSSDYLCDYGARFKGGAYLKKPRGKARAPARITVALTTRNRIGCCKFSVARKGLIPA
jgi:hypothetical protein